MSYKPEYDKKTTIEDRAVAYSRGVKYLGGEPQLAIQAAVMTAYIEGYRDHEAEPPSAEIQCSDCEQWITSPRQIVTIDNVAMHKNCPAAERHGELQT
jgi:hypothetical protein